MSIPLYSHGDYHQAFENETTYTYNFDDVIRKQLDQINAAMETAAREDIITWLRDHGYVVIEPEEQS